MAEMYFVKQLLDEKSGKSLVLYRGQDEATATAVAKNLMQGTLSTYFNNSEGTGIMVSHVPFSGGKRSGFQLRGLQRERPLQSIVEYEMNRPGRRESLEELSAMVHQEFTPEEESYLDSLKQQKVA